MVKGVRRTIERLKDHNGRDHTSHALKNTIEKSQKNIKTIDFKIIDKNFYNNKNGKLPKLYGSKTYDQRKRNLFNLNFLNDYDNR